MADPEFGFRDIAERLRGSSDRLASLDAWGPETTRRLLQTSSSEPFALEAAAAS
jgi:hypothetical protein